MQLNDEISLIINHELPGFMARAVARELQSMMLNPKSPGECPIEAEMWAMDWGVEANAIWAVIDIMTTKGFWQVDQGRGGDVLRSGQIKSSSRAIKKKGHRLDMSLIRKEAQKSRSSELGLGDVLPGAVHEICRRIPLAERKQALDDGYAGWLPTERYGLDGTVFVVNEGMVEKWQRDFEEVDVARALTYMFDDLRSERMERPSPSTFPYWIKSWIKKNGESVVPEAEELICVDTNYEVNY